MRYVRSGSVGFCFALVAACVGSDELALDAGVEEHPRYAELRARLAVTIAPVENDLTVVLDTTCTQQSDAASPCCNTEFCSARGLARFIREGCDRDTNPNTNPTNAPDRRIAGTCGNAILQADREMCVAQHLLRIIEDPGDAPIPVAPIGGGTEFEFNSLIVGPQDPETNTELAREALRRLMIVQNTTGNALNWSAPATVPPTCTTADFNLTAFTGGSLTPAQQQLTQVEELAYFYSEAVMEADVAMEHLAFNGAATSDSHFSTADDRAEAAVLRVAPFASRVHAAHVLLGGTSELPALGATANTEGLFTRPPLSRDGAQALEVIRAAGPHPDFVRSVAVDVDQLLVGGGPGMTSTDSLAYRIGRIQGEQALVDAAAAGDADLVYDRMGFDREALTEARAWVTEEIRAFDRPYLRNAVHPRRARTLPPQILRDGTMADFAIFAATRLPPSPHEDAYWGSVVRYDASLPVVATGAFPTTWPAPTPTSSGALPPGATWGVEVASGGLVTVNDRTSGRTYASMREDNVTRSRLLIGALNNAGSSAAIRRAQDLLFVALPEGAGGGGSDETTSESFASTSLTDGALLGRARVCTRSSRIRVELDLTASGVTSPDGIEIVLGPEALECAVRGTEDGAPCTPEAMATYMPTIAAPLTQVAGGPDGVFSTEFAADPRTGPASTTAVYVVRRNPGLDRPRTPGDYRTLIGFLLPPNGATSARCVGAPITPDLERRARELIDISHIDPARPAQDCSGLPFDLRIPLENELTEDGIPHESSWRHYLDEARVASDASDLLAEELVRLGLEMDMRAEREGDELERLCGVRLNLTEFARTLPDRVHPPPCNEYDSEVTDSGVTLCVLDPIRYASFRGAIASPEDRARLEQCIGSESIAELVALGDQPVCLWHDDGNPSALCNGATSERPCPAVNLAATAPSNCDVPAGTEPVLVTNPNLLRLFAVPPPTGNEDTGGGVNVLPCEALARIRAGSGTNADVDEVAGSGLLNAEVFRGLARQLGWAPMVGDFSRVTLGRSTIASTGWPGIDADDDALWPASQVTQGLDVVEALCPAGVPTGDPSMEERGIFCLADVSRAASGTGRVARARMNDMLARAVIAARVISGAGLADEVYVPYAPRIRGRAFATPAITVTDDYTVNATTRFFRAISGSLALDQPGDGGGATAFGFDQLRATVEWTTGSTLAWSTCAHEGGPCRFRIDADAFEGRDALVSYRLPSAVDAETTTESNASIFFNAGGVRGLLAEMLDAEQAGSLPGDELVREFERGGDGETIGLDDLTDYFVNRLRVGYDSGHGCFDGCDCDERPLACIGGAANVDVRSSVGGNEAFIGAIIPSPDPFGEPTPGLTRNDILNGMELVCLAGRLEAPSATFGCDNIPEDINTVGGMLQVQHALECQADGLDRAASATVIANLPASAIEAIRNSGPSTLGTNSGDIAAAVNDLRTALLALRDIRSDVADEIELIADQIANVRSAIRISDLAREIEELNLASEILSQVSTCALALTNADWKSPMSIAGASTVCGNAIAQSAIATVVSGLRDATEAERLRQVFTDFDIAVNGSTRRIRDSIRGVTETLALIDSSLSRLNSARSSARRALARALFLESDGTEAHIGVSAVYRNRYNTTLVRYRRAHTRAIRAAFIARRAVEQRLAMPLETMTDDLPTVEAPYRWVDELCRIPPVDYSALMRPTDAPEDPGPEGPTGYADMFIGDYVDRLSDVVESYSFAFPFHEGTDTAVISLRDDVFSATEKCEVPVPNLLLESERLETRATEDAPGWEARGCTCPAEGAACGGATPDCCGSGSGCVDLSSDPNNCGYCGHSCGPDAVCDGGVCRCLLLDPTTCVFPPDDPADAVVGAHCASARPLREDEAPLGDPAGSGTDLGTPTGFEIAFGGDLGAGALVDARWAQEILLEEGVYRLSWYGRRPTESFVDPELAVLATGAESGPLLDTHPRASSDAGAGWRRYHHYFRVPITQTVEIALSPRWMFPGSARLQVAGLMIEDVTGSFTGDFYRNVPDPSDPPMTRPLNEVYGPGPYHGTRETSTRILSVCPDRDGSTFRAENWTYGCTRVCPDGYDGACDDFLASRRCYHQISIPFDSATMDRVLTATPAGFAGGNYNYRVDSLAVNVVGVGVRECDDSPSCFGSGNVSYSLLHVGSFPVLNARGEEYLAPLFPGRLESARALLAERYITNPISSADRALLDPYMRLEWAGRPLAATAILRIWDEPGLNFERVEDVQLILNYRYWTHQR